MATHPGTKLNQKQIEHGVMVELHLQFSLQSACFPNPRKPQLRVLTLIYSGLKLLLQIAPADGNAVQQFDQISSLPVPFVAGVATKKSS